MILLMAIVIMLHIPSMEAASSPVMEAVHSHDQEALARCIVQGFDINSIQDGVTPLYCASEQGDLALVKQLLQAQAQVDLPSHNGMTPLMGVCLSASDQTAATMVELIRAGAHVEVQDRRGRTALMLAAGQGRLDLVLILLGTGHAYVQSVDIQGMTPLMYATMRKSSLISTDIATHSHASLHHPHSAISHEHLIIMIDALVRAGARIDEQDAFGRTPLMHAIINGREEIVVRLIEMGADVNHVDALGRTPLLCEAQRHVGSSSLGEHVYMGRLTHTIFEALLRADADPYRADENNNTPFSLMLQSGSSAKSIFEALLETHFDWKKFEIVLISTMGGSFMFGVIAGTIYKIIEHSRISRRQRFNADYKMEHIL